MPFASTIASNLVAFVIVLGFLIFAHESGHFVMAKLFKVRVLVFSFGFGKRLFGFRKGSTDYRVSLIPLGGYVRMAGDTPEENQPANPDEFLSKPKWQRFLILFAGPFMNLVIAVAFGALLLMIGLKQLITYPIVGEVLPNKPAARAGLQVGDRIVRVNGETIDDFEDLRLIVSMHAGTPLRVEFLRKGVARSTTLTPEREDSEFGPVGRAGIAAQLESVLGGVEPGSPAARAGLQAGDRIVAANGKPVSTLDDYGRIAEASKNGPIALTVLRAGTLHQLTLPPAANAQNLARGIYPPYRVQKLPLGPALQESVKQNIKMVRYAFITIGRLFRSEGSMKELSGPISIARISGEMLRRGWLEVIALMSMISLQLGIMNLLPIPVLDGGHIFVLLVEGIARRDLSLQVKERIQQLGFAALAVLMIVVLYNDVISNVTRKG
jgi:regulator of sigma E protease